MAGRNPPWSRDELILALDMYMDNPQSPPAKTSRAIGELSDTLNRLGQRYAVDAERFRNANGVYMKLMNFRRFDPQFAAAGKVGLQRGGKEEEYVWRDFADDRNRLRKVAKAIESNIYIESPNFADQSDDIEIAEAEEGRILTSVHRRRERSRKLVERKKAKALRESGKLACESCGFDFELAYGSRGHGFIECHHTKPVHTLMPGSKTMLEDLALLCSNCHRMVHVARPWLTMQQLRSLVSGD